MRMKNIVILTIVLVIVLTLFLFIALHFFTSREAPRSQSVKYQMELVRSAISAYIINTGKLPRTLEDLIYCPEGLEESWKGPYLKLSQLFDPWDNMYILEYGYRLQSLGADGIKGGVGQNADIEKFTELTK
jgi:hypothetical protein